MLKTSVKTFGTVNSIDKIIHINFLPIITSLCLISACSAGKTGECYYETVETHAEVIEIERKADGNLSVILDFKASKLALEDQRLEDLKELQIDSAYILRNRIAVGNKYEVVVSQITSGNCIPQFVSFNHDLD